MLTADNHADRNGADSAVTALSAKEEWARMWPVPLTTMLGISGTALFSGSSGVFLLEMTRAFGWSRTQFSLGLSLQLLLSVLLAPIIGRVVVRWGSRRVALAGIGTLTIGISTLGLASGSLWQWYLLCTFLMLCMTLVHPTVWITAVVSHFRTSRGLSVAIALAGAGLGNALWPLTASAYVRWLGWRIALPALALTWTAFALPLTCKYLRTAKRERPIDRASPSLLDGRGSFVTLLRSRAFVGLMLSGSLFGCMSFGFTVHLVPIAREHGFSLVAAGGVASVAGLAGLAGRILTGFVLDRFAARSIGICLFMLPVASGLLLIFAGHSFAAMLIAAILFGLATGGENDLVTFVASRLLELNAFTRAYAVIIALFSITASVGPFLAGYIFDRTGSYQTFLILVILATSIGAIIMWFMLPSNKNLNVAAEGRDLACTAENDG